MNLPEYSLRSAKVIWFFLAVLLAGGALGFATLGKKEDAVFVIKSASLVCSYPGATPQQVEELVTEPIEREVQSMRRVHKITSESYYGLSKIQVELDPATPAAEIPQLWDELRRKVLNVQPRLPAGASAVTVADDFGDVYGIYYGLSVDGGFTWSELRDWAQRLKTALVTVDGVQKVALYGEQTPVVNVYVSMATLANFAIRPETIVATIGQQNSIVDSGEKQAGKLQIQILEDGTYKTLDDLSDQLLISSSGKQYRLGDIARVERGYAEPPQTMMRVDGRRAVGIGVSTEEGVDVVKTGAEIESLLASLTRQMPLGMELTVLYPENRIAREANSTFILNLAESVAIVILIIMLVMGFRAGVLIGSSLLFSIGGTLLLMQFLGEGLNRTSLAGFIIAPLMPTALGKGILISIICIGICDALEFAPRTREASIILMAGYIATSAPRLGLYTGGGEVTLAMQLLASAGIHISWIDYFIQCYLPNIIYSICSLAVLILIMRPNNTINARAYLEEQFAKLGPMSVKEKKATAIFVLLVILMMTDKYHGIDIGWIMMLVGFACFLPGLHLVDSKRFASLNMTSVLFVVGCMSIGAGAQATGVDKLCAESLSPLLQGTGELTTMITAYLAGIGVNFLLTPVAGVSTFTVPLAELTNSIGISPFAPVYSFLYGLDQYVLPYEYAVFLYFFSTGYIHLKHLIQVFAVRAIITFILLIAVFYPFWKLTNAL